MSAYKSPVCEQLIARSEQVMTINGRSIRIASADLKYLDQLGRGASGEVVRMSHPKSGTIMAVKEISYRDVVQLRTEIEVSCALHVACPFAVDVYGVLSSDTYTWICMEVMDASLSTLNKRLNAAGGRMPEAVLGTVVVSVVQALNYLKERLNVMHRDVKPSNTLVNRRGEVKVCDYGISTRLATSMVHTTHTAGSYRYMAPERLLPSPAAGERTYRYDFRSDVWSLGISLLELANGETPYDEMEYTKCKQYTRVAAPRMPAGRYSPEFDALVEACLQLDYEARPQFEALMAHAFVQRHAAAGNAAMARFVNDVLDGVEPPIDIGDIHQLAPVRRLDRGSYGITYEMLDRRSGTPIAVKRVNVGAAGQRLSAEHRKQLGDLDAALLPMRQCPFAVRSFGALFQHGAAAGDDDYVWICMELMDASLGKLCAMAHGHGRRPPEPVLGKVVWCVLQALNSLHVRLRVVHRDVKPSNILINRRGEVKIGDFGISGHLVDTLPRRLEVEGNMPYMAPERYKALLRGDPTHYDIRSDVWSLGISLMELANGERPYGRWQNGFEQMKHVMCEDEPRMQAGRYSTEFDRFIEVCLQRNYENRPLFHTLMAHAFVQKHCTVERERLAEFVGEILDLPPLPLPSRSRRRWPAVARVCALGRANRCP